MRKITAIAVVGRTVQVCATAMIGCGLFRVLVGGVPVLLRAEEPTEYNMIANYTFALPGEISPPATVALVFLCIVGIVLVWGFPAIYEWNRHQE